MTNTTALAPCHVEVVPADRHPAKVYLAGLAPSSRRTMRDALNVIADMLTSGRRDLETLDWSAIRYQHAQAVRAALAEKYAPATANKMLAALRGFPKEAWRLRLIGAKVSFHGLRHSAATLMLARGAGVKVVQDMLGHSTPMLTLGTYGHVLKAHQQDAAR
jgi:hypothetical protein